VIGESDDEVKGVFQEKALEVCAPLYFAFEEFDIPVAMNGVDGTQVFQVYEKGKLKYENLKLDLLGMYQKKNLKTVLNALFVLKESGMAISDQAIYSGLNHVVSNTGLSCSE
jgi:dihydrofolate synthase/folylpolyglutamate synthase